MAQASTATITGYVTDQSNAAVVDATVNVINVDTNVRHSTRTNGVGIYTVPELVPGNYRIEVEKQGFKSIVKPDVVLHVQDVIAINFQMAIGTTSESITVTAGAPLLQTENASLGRVTDELEVVSLPLANRNFTQILGLSTGISADLPDAGAVGRNSQDVSDNGARTTHNEFTFNGIDAVNIAENSSAGFSAQVGLAVPAPDTIQEFKAQTGLYDASGGRSAGANVDIVSKSGTNSLHGTLWEFLRNDDLNANEFFLNRAGQPRPVLKQNQFGFTLGGPIRKNKTFFFGGYQGTIQRNGVSSMGLMTANLPAALTNDRSAATLGAEFAGQTGLFGGVPIAPDGSNINPVALALLNFKFTNGAFAIPTPTTIVQTPTGPLGLFTLSSPVKYREDQFTVNLDHAISDKNQLAAKVFYANAPTTAPFFRLNLPGWGLDSSSQNAMAVLSDTNTFKSTIVNVARVGYVRFDGTQTQPQPITNSDIGLTGPLGLPGMPQIDVLGLFGMGPDLQLRDTTNNFEGQDTLSMSFGKHSLRLGGGVTRIEHNYVPHYYDKGLLYFLSFPDFLLGQSGAQNGSGLSNVYESLALDGSLDKAERYTDISAFAQDDIKVTRRFTMNLGVRWEFDGPPSDIHGRLANFDPSLAVPVPPPAGTLTGIVLNSNYNGPLPAGVTKVDSTGLFNRNFKDFAPRVGFALRLRDNPGLVLRGGYGLYYSQLTAQVALQTITSTPFALDVGRAFFSNAAATFQVPFSPPLPPLSSFPLFVPRTSSSDITEDPINRAMHTPYVQQWGLNIQYELVRDFLLEVGYVGSAGTHLASSVGFNQAEIATPQNPVNGLTTTTLANVLQRAPFVGADPGYSLLTTTNVSSNYNSLQASLTKRLSHGLQFLASYTWSKSLDVSSGGTTGSGGPSEPFDVGEITNDQTHLRNAYGPSDFDRTQRFVLNFVYQPPALERGPRPLQYLLSRWQFSGLAVLQSGLPITVLDSLGGSAYGSPAFSRAECTGQPYASSGSLTQRINGYFNAAAFTTAPVIGDDGVATGFGNCGKGIIRGPSQKNLDIGIQRTFRVFKESNSLMFRAEAFNLTNTPKFGMPISDVETIPTHAFGLITSTLTNPRILQFALKFSF
jgi:hypothetical protein